ncbi:Protein of unknown function [Pyronema omphalodes CBS 100304]|uniref:Uncharacterized protein n=1 Tax=Pyronema omphalodes (strain CBS 100304) TaxID=1076935 RepID=U4LJW2_PYROM|nr:Protein of unknown function [Pyronema omphalodes CBS 100304]
MVHTTGTNTKKPDKFLQHVLYHLRLRRDRSQNHCSSRIWRPAESVISVMTGRGFWPFKDRILQDVFHHLRRDRPQNHKAWDPEDP